MAHHDKEWKRLGDGSLITEDAQVGLGHIVSVKVYNAVFISLIALTALTVWAATKHFGIFNLALAMGIATIKAGIVTLMFMHLNYEKKIIWTIVIYPIFIFLLLVAGTLGDASMKKQPVPYSSEFANQVSAQTVHVKAEEGVSSESSGHEG